MLVFLCKVYLIFRIILLFLNLLELPSLPREFCSKLPYSVCSFFDYLNYCNCKFLMNPGRFVRISVPSLRSVLHGL